MKFYDISKIKRVEINYEIIYEDNNFMDSSFVQRDACLKLILEYLLLHEIAIYQNEYFEKTDVVWRLLLIGNCLFRKFIGFE